MRHLIRFLALLLLATSMATIRSTAASAEAIVPVAVRFDLSEVKGFTFVEASERVVVAGDDEVLIFGLDGSLLHRVAGVGKATGAEEWGSHVVVIAAETHELVVIDTLTGAVSRRIATGELGVSSISVVGDTAWFAHGPDQWNSGIARADLSTGLIAADRLGPHQVYAGAAIGGSSGRPNSVFATNPSLSPTGLFRYDALGGSFHGSPHHESFFPFVVSDAGDRLWALNNAWSTNPRALVEISTDTLAKTGAAYDFSVPAGRRLTMEHLAVHDDAWLIAGVHREVRIFSIGQLQPVHAVSFSSAVAAVDISADRMFVVDGSTADQAQPTGPRTLWIGPHDFVPPRPVIRIGIEAFGTPGSDRPNLVYWCSDGTQGTIPALPYGWWTWLEVEPTVSYCRVTLSHVDEPHRTYRLAADGTIIEGVEALIEITGDPSRDVASFLQILRSPLNDATTFVEQQYHDILQRYPDPAGVQYWASLLETGRIADYQMVQQFVESPEFLGSMSPAMRLYLAYFGRWPDDAGLDYWANAIRSGTQVARISDFFATSPEFMARYGSLSNRDFVTLVYTNVLGRSPDAAGYNFWLGRMSAGLSRGQVMTNFSESAEYVGQTRAPITVRSLYLGLLQREPDADGFAFWTQRNRSEPSLAPLIVGFLDSDEYANRFWFWDDGPLPVTQAGALKRSGVDAVEMTRCDGRCVPTGSGWLEASTHSLAE